MVKTAYEITSVLYRGHYDVTEIILYHLLTIDFKGYNKL